MKRTVSILTLFILLLTFTYGVSLCQKIDLSGTWEGSTDVPDIPEPVKMTLVLEKTDEGYSGTINDSIGMIQNAEIEDFEFEDNDVTFNFTFYDGSNYITVYIALTVEGNKMNGHWETEDGSSAPIELEKIK